MPLTVEQLIEKTQQAMQAINKATNAILIINDAYAGRKAGSDHTQVMAKYEEQIKTLEEHINSTTALFMRVRSVSNIDQLSKNDKKNLDLQTHSDKEELKKLKKNPLQKPSINRKRLAELNNLVAKTSNINRQSSLLQTALETVLKESKSVAPITQIIKDPTQLRSNLEANLRIGLDTLLLKTTLEAALNELALSPTALVALEANLKNILKITLETALTNIARIKVETAQSDLETLLRNTLRFALQIALRTTLETALLTAITNIRESRFGQKTWFGPGSKTAGSLEQVLKDLNPLNPYLTRPDIDPEHNLGLNAQEDKDMQYINIFIVTHAKKILSPYGKTIQHRSHIWHPIVTNKDKEVAYGAIITAFNKIFQEVTDNKGVVEYDVARELLRIIKEQTEEQTTGMREINEGKFSRRLDELQAFLCDQLLLVDTPSREEWKRSQGPDVESAADSAQTDPAASAIAAINAVADTGSTPAFTDVAHALLDASRRIVNVAEDPAAPSSSDTGTGVGATDDNPFNAPEDPVEDEESLNATLHSDSERSPSP